jgi:hypothetical protein
MSDTNKGTMTVPPNPVPGMGASIVLPSDRYPYFVVKVSDNKKYIDLVEITDIHGNAGRDKYGIKPEFYINGFPYYNHYFTSAQVLGEYAEWQKNPADYGKRIVERAYLRKNGHYYLKGIPLFMGNAIYRRDYSD